MKIYPIKRFSEINNNNFRIKTKFGVQETSEGRAAECPGVPWELIYDTKFKFVVYD